MQEEKEKRKEEKKKADMELQNLFKPVITQQIVAAGMIKVKLAKYNSTCVYIF